MSNFADDIINDILENGNENDNKEIIFDFQKQSEDENATESIKIRVTQKSFMKMFKESLKLNGILYDDFVFALLWDKMKKMNMVEE